MEMYLPGIVEKIRGPIALAFSYQAEDVAVLHLLLQYTLESLELEIFTVDTLKLFPETRTYHEEVEEFSISPLKAITLTRMKSGR